YTSEVLFYSPHGLDPKRLWDVPDPRSPCSLLDRCNLLGLYHLNTELS
ncbi:hypothetical protein Anas_03262, partial [Armadillidium nasatum]